MRVDIVGVDLDRFRVPFGVTSQIYRNLKPRSGCCSLGAVACQHIEGFDRIDFMALIGAWIAHDFAENRGSVDDLQLGSFPLGGAAAYPAELASLYQFDQPVV